MTIYTYQSEEFRGKLNIATAVKNTILAQIENLSILNSADNLKNYGIYKKRFASYRVIFTYIRDERIRNSDSVVLFLEIYHRDNDREYARMIDGNLNNDVAFRKENEIIDRNRTNIINQYLEDSVVETIVKPILPLDYYNWTNPPEYNNLNNRDITVYESGIWSEYISKIPKTDVKLFLYKLRRKLEVIITDSIHHSINENYPNIYFKEIDDINVLYKYINRNNNEIVFLLGFFENLDENTFGLIENKFRNIYNLNHLEALSTITKYAKKAYPFEMILDEEIWVKIEISKSNMALSGEEEALLTSLSRPEPGKKSLPVFINGRAGSGKSTMLLYLFADYCRQLIAEENTQNSNILFLSYSKKLIEDAKEIITIILTNRYNFIEENYDKRILYNVINNSFKTFGDFLFNNLKEEDKPKFLSDKKISFSYFKGLFKDSFNNQRISAETAWHVIRTFIKGWNKNEFLTPNGYENLERNNKTVNIEDYKEIYNNIFRWYQSKQLEDEIWDDLDLVRNILNNNIKLKYNVIFSDESQDFTRVELNLIFKLSAYSDYSLVEGSLSSLPFAFAGDPLQTITPTGFSWKMFEAMFYDEMNNVFTIDNPRPFLNNHYDLTFNYRSDKPIVDFSNSIQLLRKNEEDLVIEPQNSWFENVSSYPEIYIIDDNIDYIKIENNIHNVVIITPVNDGGEDFFIENDELLNRIKPNLLFSAVQSKGLEFENVILYKFGDFLEHDIESYVNSELYLKYFFNRLYVAVTRAKKQLFVVDTQSGYKKLWKFVNRNYLLEGFNRRDIWENNLEFLVKGYNFEKITNADPLEIAKELEKIGKTTQNFEHLKKAHNVYLNINLIDKANECDAYSLLFQKKYIDAGEKFKRINMKEESINAFWNGFCWNKLSEFNLLNGKKKIVDFMLEEEFIISKGNELIASFRNHHLRNTDQYYKVISKYINELMLKLKSNYSDIKIQKEEVLNTIFIIDNKEYIEKISFFIYQKEENWTKLIEVAENNEIINNKLYFEAKIKLLSFPKNIVYLHKLDKDDLILEEYTKNIELTKDERKIIQNIYLKKKNNLEYFRISLPIETSFDINNFFNKNLSEFKKIGFFEINFYIEYLAKNNNFNQFLYLYKEFEEEHALLSLFFHYLARNKNTAEKSESWYFIEFLKGNIKDISVYSKLNKEKRENKQEKLKKQYRDFVKNKEHFNLKELIELNINIYELSLALKNMDFAPTQYLPFYEDFLEKGNYYHKIRENKELDRFIRLEWLINKNMMVDISWKFYQKKKDNITLSGFRQLESQLKKKLEDWEFTLDEVKKGNTLNVILFSDFDKLKKEFEISQEVKYKKKPFVKNIIQKKSKEDDKLNKIHELSDNKKQTEQQIEIKKIMAKNKLDKALSEITLSSSAIDVKRGVDTKSFLNKKDKNIKKINTFSDKEKLEEKVKNESMDIPSSSNVKESNEYKELKKRNEQLAKSNKALNSENIDLKNSKEKELKKYKKLSKEKLDLQSSKDRLKKDNNILKKEKLLIEKRLIEKNNEIDSLKTSRMYEEKYKDLKKEQSSLFKSNEELKIKNISLNKDILELTELFEEAKEYKKYKNKYDKLLNQNENKIKEIETLNTKLNEYKKKYEDFSYIIDAQKKELVELNDILNHKNKAKDKKINNTSIGNKRELSDKLTNNNILDVLREIRNDSLKLKGHLLQTKGDEDKKKYLKLLALIMNVDGNIHEKEMRYLRLLINSLDFPSSYLDDLIYFSLNVDKKEVESILNSFKYFPLKYLALFDMTMIAYADGVLHESEENAIDILSDVLRITVDEKKNIIDFANKIKNKKFKEALINFSLLDSELQQVFFYILRYYDIDFKPDTKESEDDSFRDIRIYLENRDIKVQVLSDEETNDNLDNLAKFIGEKYSLIENFYNLLKRNLGRGTGGIYLDMKTFAAKEVGAITQLAHDLHQYAFLSEFNYQKSPHFYLRAKINKTPKTISFLTGSWLENYVKQVVLGILYNELPNESISYLSNPKVLLPDGKEFEIDLIIRVKNDDNILWIESKTGNYQSYIEKYSKLKNIFGVNTGNAILVLGNSGDETVYNYLSETYKLKVLNLDTLKDVIYRFVKNLKN